MMEKTKIEVEVVRYTDQQGNPTCATNFETGEICEFYRTQRLGTHETCLFSDPDRRYQTHLKRRISSKGIEGDGTLIPCDNCLVWKRR